MDYIVHYDKYRRAVVPTLEEAHKFIGNYIADHNLNVLPISHTINQSADIEIFVYQYFNGNIETFTITLNGNVNRNQELLNKVISNKASQQDKLNLYKWCLRNIHKGVEYDTERNSFHLYDGYEIQLIAKMDTMSARDLLMRIQYLEEHERHCKPRTLIRSIDEWITIDSNYLFQIVDIKINKEDNIL